ncbi:unnamed protein product [Sphagnum balticum]
MAATTTTASPLLLQSSSWATACKRSTHHGILSFINSSSQETAAVKLSPMHTSPLRISRKGKTLHYGSHGRFSCHRAVVSAEYRRGGAGAGDFVAGFLLGGVVFGALGYLLAPQITKSISEDIEKEEEDGPRKRPARFLEDDEGLEKTRKNLNEKIAQLNAAIDDVSAQLRSEDGFGNPNETTAELESAA